MIITFLLYPLGLMPSLIWLLFYLRKDKHPEPNRMVLRVFFLGAMAGFFAILLEKGFQSATENVFLASFALDSFLAIFLGGALIEEIVKALAAKIGTFHSKELDEPIDLILYMIISALGFAALENILVLSNFHPVLNASKAFQLMFWRFISATFLHALVSGIWGCFMVFGALKSKMRYFYFVAGLLIASLLHGLYNFAIMNLTGLPRFLVPASLLLISAIFVSLSIKRIKKYKSVCNLYL